MPDIHAIGEGCARRLGIGAPRIFLEPSAELNAWTLASDDHSPSVFLTTELVEKLSDAELMAIIGHECGHIHNVHGPYAMLANLGLGISELASLTTQIAMLAPKAAFAKWSCCAEVTCDRAGAICAGSPLIMAKALAKLASGGLDINIDAYVRQTQSVGESIFRLREIFDSHPLTHKRIQAVQLFGQSDAFRLWRPDYQSEEPVRPLADIDEECEALMSTLLTKKLPIASSLFAVPFRHLGDFNLGLGFHQGAGTTRAEDENDQSGD